MLNFRGGACTAGNLKIKGQRGTLQWAEINANVNGEVDVYDKNLYYILQNENA